MKQVDTGADFFDEPYTGGGTFTCEDYSPVLVTQDCDGLTKNLQRAMANQQVTVNQGYRGKKATCGANGALQLGDESQCKTWVWSINGFLGRPIHNRPNNGAKPSLKQSLFVLLTAAAALLAWPL